MSFNEHDVTRNRKSLVHIVPVSLHSTKAYITIGKIKRITHSGHNVYMQAFAKKNNQKGLAFTVCRQRREALLLSKCHLLSHGMYLPGERVTNLLTDSGPKNILKYVQTGNVNNSVYFL